MASYPFLKYSFQTIFRNWRRTVFSIIGIILAVSLIAGESISVDSSVSQMIKKQIDQVPYDFYGISGTSMVISQANINALNKDITSVKNVVGCSSIVSAQCSITKENNHSYMPMFYLSGVDQTYINNKDKFGFVGDILVGNSSIVISKNIARDLSVNVGDFVNVSIYSVENKTFRVSSIIETNTNDIGYRSNSGFSPMYYNSAYISLNDMLGYSASTSYMKINTFIWVERNQVIDAGNVDQTTYNLKRMERSINNAIADFDVNVHYNQEIISTLDSFQFTLIEIRFIYIALSIPVLILGAYLGTIGAELSYAERRREIGILKSRGASDGSIFTLLLGETIFLGVIAGIFGLLLGVVISTAMSFSSSGLLLLQPSTSLVGFTISPLTVAISIIFSIILVLFAHYRPARRASKIVIRDALQSYSTEESKLVYKPWIDIIFIVIASITYIGMVSFSSLEASGPPSEVILGLLCVMLVLMVLMPFAPFLLIIGVSRLATRSSTKIYEGTSNILKPVMKDLHPILKKNVRRNPKRASSVSMLIAIALSFGLFVSITYESQMAYDKNVILADVGSDMKITVSSPGVSLNSIKLRGNESLIPGATAWSESENYALMIENTQTGVNGYSIQSSSYSHVVHVDQSAFVSGDPSQINSLKDGKNAIISQYLSTSEGYSNGDIIKIKFTNQVVNYSITGIVKYLPGFAVNGLSQDLIFFDSNTVPSDEYKINWILFVDITSSKIQDAAKYVRNTYGSDVDVKVYQEEYDNLMSDPITGSLYGFLNTEYVFALVIIAIGITMIMFMAIRERKHEIANMAARGASFRNLMSLVSGEGIVISLVGLFIGLFTGILTAYVFNVMFSKFLTTSNIVDRTVVISWGSLIIVLLTVVVLFLSSILISLTIRKLKLSEILRWRGG